MEMNKQMTEKKEGEKFSLKKDDAFYLVKHSEGYSIFVSFQDASIEIHDERYDDDNASLLKFYLVDKGKKEETFRVDQVSWKEIVKAYHGIEKKKEKEENNKK